MNNLALLSLAAVVAAATAPGLAQTVDPASQRDAFYCDERTDRGSTAIPRR